MVTRPPEADAAHRRRSRNLTVLVLIVWAVFVVGIYWFARPLNTVTFIGFPLGYWFAAEGSLVAFVLLAVYQNWRQDGIDDEAGQGE